ncbi:Kinesin motor domain-containing protein [Plasmodiophora brassicae]|uniref:Kinesin motor domain-containing protein n=1 Tax=Plasmodiophora brassicae TaxID=37360 RepID=A0A3P3YCU1_PLABS|nr:unnamed protein product [Plasmodiophora brassicae]
MDAELRDLVHRLQRVGGSDEARLATWQSFVLVHSGPGAAAAHRLQYKVDQQAGHADITVVARDGTRRRYRASQAAPQEQRPRLQAAILDSALEWVCSGFHSTIVIVGQSGLPNPVAVADHLLATATDRILHEVADGNDHQEVTVALWEVDDHSKTAVDILSRVVTGQRRVLKPNEHPVQVQVQTVSQVHNIMDIAAATGSGPTCHRFWRVSVLDHVRNTTCALNVVEVADDALAIASLGRLLTQLADPATGAHVHAFRDTKLTEHVGPMLTHNSKSILVVCVADDEANFLGASTLLHMAEQVLTMTTPCVRNSGPGPSRAKADIVPYNSVRPDAPLDFPDGNVLNKKDQVDNVMRLSASLDDLEKQFDLIGLSSGSDGGSQAGASKARIDDQEPSPASAGQTSQPLLASTEERLLHKEIQVANLLLENAHLQDRCQSLQGGSPVGSVLADADRRVDRLQRQVARLRRANADLELQLSSSTITGYRPNSCFPMESVALRNLQRALDKAQAKVAAHEAKQADADRARNVAERAQRCLQSVLQKNAALSRTIDALQGQCASLKESAQEAADRADRAEGCLRDTQRQVDYGHDKIRTLEAELTLVRAMCDDTTRGVRPPSATAPDRGHVPMSRLLHQLESEVMALQPASSQTRCLKLLHSARQSLQAMDRDHMEMSRRMHRWSTLVKSISRSP